jgi:hypothetical protein
MPGNKSRTRNVSRQQVARINARHATKILEECDNLLHENGDLVSNLRRIGFGVLLNALSLDILQLALQPDSWGERLRARLMSEIVPALQGDLSEQNAVGIDYVAHCASIVVPCFLLEFGRRNQHIQIEFPSDPTSSSARFNLSAGRFYPVHSINSDRLLRLASSVGEELVGLCYFGDQQSRDWIEAELGTQHAPN